MVELHPYFLQFLLLGFGLCETILIVLSLTKNKELVFQNRASKFSFFILFVSLIGCINAYLVTDVRYVHIFQNSHSDQAWYMKIASIWSHHETSFFFWFCIFYFSNYKADSRISLFRHVYSLIFSLFIIFDSNPFAISQGNLLVQNAKGLNPLLYDMNMVWHPPLLYLGQALTFRLFLKSLIQPLVYKKDLLLSLIVLTVAIATGSLWAFTQLGWGGFWFWDPVEILSVLPWFILVLILHLPENYICSRPYICQLPFFSTIFSIAIIRSGLIRSVHSFSKNISCFWFMSGLFLGTFLIVGMTYVKYQKDKKEGIAAIGPVVIFLLTLIVLLFSVLHNLFSYNELKEVFFHKILTPIWSVANGYFIYQSLKKISRDANPMVQIGIIVLLVLISALFYFLIFIHLSYLYAVLGVTSFLNILLHLISIKKNIASSIAHIGLSILLLGLSLHSYSKPEELIHLKLGETVKFGDLYLKWIRDDWNKSQFVDHHSLSVEIRSNSKSVTLKPQELFFHSSQQKRYQADYTRMADCIVMIISFSYDSISNSIDVNIALKHGVIWVVVGGAFVFLSLCLVILRRNGKYFLNIK